MANTRGLRAGKPEENVGERSLSLVSGPVLVTGGAGYIGSHVCKALAEAGIQPICLDTLEKGHDWAVRWGSLERGDVGDGRFVEVQGTAEHATFDRRQLDAMLDLALAGIRQLATAQRKAVGL